MGLYVFSDLHGQYNLWEKIKNKITPKDTFYCLGDNIDRGPDGYKICKEQQKIPNLIVLKGNHEAMAAAAIPDMLLGHDSSDVFNWCMNGGNETWLTLMDETESDSEIYSFQTWCDHLPTKKIVTNNKGQIIHLTHAGFTFGNEELSDLLWDRQHFYDSWPECLPNASSQIIIHGHTPVQYLAECLGVRIKNPPEIITYCAGHKIDIDLCSVVSHRAALLNLNTFEVIYIE